MKKALLFIFLIALTSLVQAAKITDTVLHVGPKATDEFTILHKDGGYLKKTGSQGDWFFSKDGVLEKKIGSGSGSGGDGGVNILLNASFEDGLTNWSNSGGTLTQETYTTGSESNTKFARFVASGAGQYVESDCTDKPDFLSGGGMADIRYTTTDNELFELKVFDCTTSDVEISTATVAAQADWGKIPTQTFDLYNRLKLRVVSLGAATIDFDEVYTGSNKGFIASQSQAKSISYTPVFTEFGTPTEVDFTYMQIGDKLHIQGRFRAGTLASSTEARVSLPPGFTVKFQDSINKPVGVYYRLNSSGNSGGSVILKDGETYLKFSASSVFGTAGVDPSTPVGSGGMINNAEAISVNVIVPVGATSPNTQEAFTPEQADFGYIGVFNAIGGAAASSFTPVIDSSGLCELQNKKGSAKITCHDGSTGTSNCDGVPSDEQFGIQIYLPVAGRYKVCATASMDNGGANRYRINKYINETNTIEVAGDIEVRSPTDAGFSSLCQEFVINSVGLHTFKVDVFALNTAYNFCNSKNSSMTVDLVNHNTSRPIVNNMVSTAYKDGAIGNHCTFDGVSVTRDPYTEMCSSWIDSTSNVGHGETRINFKAGAFNGDVECQGTGLADSRYISFKSTDKPEFDGTTVRITDPTGATSNDFFTLSCWSKRK